MKLFVKICGLQEAQHVKAAIEGGADAVGFVFADSVRRVTPANAAAISKIVPQHFKRVAVMLRPSDAAWQEVLETLQPDVLQADADDFAGLDVPQSVERWPVHREGHSLPPTRGAYVYEGKRSGRGETVDWSRAAALAKRGQMILAGGLSATNVADAIKIVQPFGVDVSSAVESAPGQKSAGKIIEFIKAVRAAENNS